MIMIPLLIKLQDVVNHPTSHGTPGVRWVLGKVQLGLSVCLLVGIGRSRVIQAASQLLASQPKGTGLSLLQPPCPANTPAPDFPPPEESLCMCELQGGQTGVTIFHVVFHGV